MGQRAPRLHGLRPSRRHPGRNWQLDCDYAHKLSPAEAEWLSRFYDESYHSVPYKEATSLHGKEGQKAMWRAYKANERDALTRSQAVNRLDGLDARREEGQDAWAGRLYATSEGHAPWAAEDAALEALDARIAYQRKISKASVCLKPRRPPRPPQQLLLPLPAQRRRLPPKPKEKARAKRLPRVRLAARTASFRSRAEKRPSRPTQLRLSLDALS